MAGISREQEFEKFLAKAERKTWVVQENKVIQSSIPGAKQYSYQDGEWSYLDTFFVSADKTILWGFEVVRQHQKVIMNRHYHGVVKFFGVELTDEWIDLVNNRLREFRGSWLEFPVDTRRGRVVLDSDPDERWKMSYCRCSKTDEHGVYEEETIDVALVTVSRIIFRRVMMAELAP